MAKDPDTERKVNVLHQLVSDVAEQGGAPVNDGTPHYTPKERLIRISMGMIILAIGLYSALGLGLARVCSEDGDIRGVAQFLVFLGLVFSQVGAAYVQCISRETKFLGQALFCICFLVSTLIILFGLRTIFGETPVGIYLMLVGFCSSIIAAVAMR